MPLKLTTVTRPGSLAELARALYATDGSAERQQRAEAALRAANPQLAEDKLTAGTPVVVAELPDLPLRQPAAPPMQLAAAPLGDAVVARLDDAVAFTGQLRKAVEEVVAQEQRALDLPELRDALKPAAPELRDAFARARDAAKADAEETIRRAAQLEAAARQARADYERLPRTASPPG